MLRKNAGKRKNMRRRATLLVASALIGAMLMSGAYAWTDYSQTVTNSFNGVASNQVLLHDDFDGENKDVYVENLGDSPVFVRVKMAEYLQVGNQSQLAAYDNPDAKGDTADVTTWAIHTWGDDLSDTTCEDDASLAHKYYVWELGNIGSSQKYYLSGITESDNSGHGGLSDTAFNALKLNAEVTVGTITTYKRATLAPSNVMTMSKYVALLDKLDDGSISSDEQALLETPRWVLDTDGWAYWSHPLQPDTATNLLLDKVTMTEDAHPDDNWAYNIDVQMQAVSANQLSSWYRDNDGGISMFSLVADDVDDTAKKVIANPDNSVMTATENAVHFIDTKSEMSITAGEVSEPIVPAPTLKSGSDWYQSTKTAKDEITTIHFVSSIDIPAGAESWDASAAGDGSITCVIIDNELYISSNGARKVLAGEDASGMFEGFSSVTEIEDLSMLNTAKTTDMSDMFKGCENLQNVDVSSFNTENVTNMTSMFEGCENLESLDISNFNTDKVTENDNMVADCGTQTDDFTITVSDGSMKNWVEETEGFPTDNKFVANESSTLAEGDSWYKGKTPKDSITEVYFVTDVDKSNATETWDASADGDGSITCVVIGDKLYICSNGAQNIDANENASNMFDGFTNLEHIDNLTMLDTSSTTDMSDMFKGCENLEEVDVSNFDTSNVTDMSGMFEGCENLGSLDISGFDTSNVTNNDNMMTDCGTKTDDFTITVSDGSMKNWVEESKGFPEDNKFEANESSTLAAGDTWFNTEKASKDDITNVHFVTSVDKTGADAVWDASEAQDGSITCVVKGGELYICSNGADSIIANEDASSMFEGFTGLTKIDGLSMLDTSSTTDMSDMFKGCEKLGEVDVTGFDTTNVTDMSGMFQGCENLESLDISNFNTEKVENKDNMVADCGTKADNFSIEVADGEMKEWIEESEGFSEDNKFVSNTIPTLAAGSSWYSSNVSKADITAIHVVKNVNKTDATATWDASANSDKGVTCYVINNVLYISSNGASKIVMSADASSAFAGFTAATVIDGLELLDTSAVTNMNSLFAECNKVTALTLTGWNTSNVTDMAKMFYNCAKLATLDVSGLNTANVKTMANMFDGCASLTSQPWSTTASTSSAMFSSYSARALATSLASDSAIMLADTVSAAGFTTKNVTDLSNLFANCTGLTSLNLTGLDTSSATNMSGMFKNCSSLTSLDVSKLTTTQVTDMSSMFQNCSAVTSLDVSKFTTTKVTNTSNMFNGCTKLTSLNLTGFNTGITTKTDMFTNCGGTNFTITAGTDTVKTWAKTGTGLSDSTYYLTSNAATLLANSGWYKGTTAKTSITAINFVKTLSLSGAAEVWDASSAQDKGIVCWVNGTTLYISSTGADTITANADSSSMFSGFTALKTIDTLTMLNTASTTNMSSMFYNCKALTTMTLTSFNTASVTNMSNMFYGCAAATSLALTSFTTTAVTDMSGMFQGCSALTSLTINTTNFNTAKVTTMANMFNGCSSATSLPVTSFTTTAVTTMANMFYGCSKVTSLALTNFTTTAVTDMSYMFYNCSALTTLTVTSFNTAKVTNMTSMFQNCSAVTVLNVSNFNTAAVTNMSNMFNGCSKVTSLNLRNFNTDKVTSKDGMFTSCGSSSSSFTVNVANSTKASWVKATSSYPSYIDVIDWTTVVTGSDSVYYISLGTNLYKKLGLQSSGAYAKVSISVAGQDRTIGTSDDNLLSGRTAAMGGSIAVGTVYTAGTGSLTTSAYYTISGANSSYYVTAGSDGLLGTWDDVIKDGSGNGKLGTYDINATGTKIDMGWVFVKGSSVSKMLLASEYVLDSTAFNTSSSTATYANSTLFTTMASIYTKAGGTKTAILQNQSISMADYTGTVTYIYQCTTSGHTDSSGYHTATSGCSASITNTGGKATPTSAIKNQTNVTATFFALSMQEMAEAYNNDADYNVSADYRRAKYAACGSGNYNFSGTYNGTKIQAAYYWLRSPGHLSTYASYVSVYGYVDTLYSVSNTTIGARPACYATLVS